MERQTRTGGDTTLDLSEKAKEVRKQKWGREVHHETFREVTCTGGGVSLT